MAGKPIATDQTDQRPGLELALATCYYQVLSEDRNSQNGCYVVRVVGAFEVAKSRIARVRQPKQSVGMSAMRSSAGFQPAVSQCFQPASRTIPTVPGSTRTACRLEIGDTAGWKPALRGLARESESHLGTVFPLPRLRLTRMRTA